MKKNLQMLDTILEHGWSYHDTEPERLAKEMEALHLNDIEAQKITQLVTLASHTIGEHLNQWARTRQFCESVFSDRAEQMSARDWSFLSVSRYMDNDIEGALHAELQAASLSAEQPIVGLIDTKIMLVKAMLVNGEDERLLPILQNLTTLTMSHLKDSTSVRTLAITCNNVANDLLAATNRIESQNKLMRLASESAFTAWSECGTWVNKERALYLLQLVENALGNTKKALEYGKRALEVIHQNGSEPIDEAFIYLAIAHSHKLDLDISTYELELAKADSLASRWDDASLVDWYTEERSKVLED